MRITVSRARDIGGRPYQEDRLLAQKFAHDRFIIAAIMDGHAGGQCSAFLQRQLMDSIYIEMLSNGYEALGTEQLRKALHSLHLQWERCPEYNRSGSTLSGLIIDKFRPFDIWFFNLGDSQALMFDINGTVKHRTDIHDLSEKRRKQVQARYPSVSISNDIFGGKRVRGQNSSLNLSGAYGDTVDPILRKCLIKDVDIRKVSIDKIGSPRDFPMTVVLGSDGLWDELKHDEVKRIVFDTYRRAQTPGYKLISTPADELMQAVKQRGLKKDNVSIIVMTLEQDKTRNKSNLSTPRPTSSLLPLLSPS